MSNTRDEQRTDPRPDDLTGIVTTAWESLRAGVTQRKHGFHQPVFVTAGRDGQPEARTVVLRGANEERREIRCHTDARSPKVAEINHDPRVLWVLYDPTSRVQLRLRARAEVLTEGPVPDDAWERTRLMSRRCYLAPHAPSDVTERFTPNLPPEFETRDPNQAESEQGRTNFAVVRSVVHEVDWLILHHAGHRRARLLWNDRSASWDARWLAP